MVDLDLLNQHNVCPQCRCVYFLIGPSGGAAVNIKCAGCGIKFWFAPPFTPMQINNDDAFYRGSPVVLAEWVRRLYA